MARRKSQGHVGGYVEGVMWTLVEAARLHGCFGRRKSTEVDRLSLSLTVRRKRRATDAQGSRSRPPRTDWTTPGTMDAFLSLAARTVERVLKSGKRSMVKPPERSNAHLPLSSGYVRHCGSTISSAASRPDFHTMWLDGRERIVVRVRAEHVKNLQQQLEHFLNERHPRNCSNSM